MTGKNCKLKYLQKKARKLELQLLAKNDLAVMVR